MRDTRPWRMPSTCGCSGTAGTDATDGSFGTSSVARQVDDRAVAGLGGDPGVVERAAGDAGPLGQVVLGEAGSWIAEVPVGDVVVTVEAAVARRSEAPGDVAGR